MSTPSNTNNNSKPINKAELNIVKAKKLINDANEKNKKIKKEIDELKIKCKKEFKENVSGLINDILNVKNDKGYTVKSLCLKYTDDICKMLDPLVSKNTPIEDTEFINLLETVIKITFESIKGIIIIDAKALRRDAW